MSANTAIAWTESTENPLAVVGAGHLGILFD